MKRNFKAMKEAGREKIIRAHYYGLSMEEIGELLDELVKAEGNIDSLLDVVVSAYYIGIESGYRMATRRGKNTEQSRRR